MDVFVEFVPAAEAGEPRARSGLRESTRSAERFATLPEPIRLEDTVTSVDTVTRSGPSMTRDPEVDFMIRYGMP